MTIQEILEKKYKSGFEIIERRFIREPHCGQHTAFKIKLTDTRIIDRVCTQCGCQILDKRKW